MADIAGYTKLMGSDEKGTHARVLGFFAELVEPTVAEHRGHVVKTRVTGSSPRSTVRWRRFAAPSCCNKAWSGATLSSRERNGFSIESALT